MLECKKCGNTMQYIAKGHGGFESGIIHYHYECQGCGNWLHSPVPQYIPEGQIERYINAKV